MLQKFLNSKVDAKLPVTGTFGTLTEKALKKFQLEYKDSILTPWVEAGLMKDTTPTGYFFKTTQYSVNKMICPNATIEAPVLK